MIQLTSFRGNLLAGMGEGEVCVCKANCLTKKKSQALARDMLHPASTAVSDKTTAGTLNSARFSKVETILSPPVTEEQQVFRITVGRAPHITLKLDQQMIIWKKISFASEWSINIACLPILPLTPGDAGPSILTHLYLPVLTCSILITERISQTLHLTAQLPVQLL